MIIVSESSSSLPRDAMFLQIESNAVIDMATERYLFTYTESKFVYQFVPYGVHIGTILVQLVQLVQYWYNMYRSLCKRNVIPNSE